jgi:hypothetical protein
MSNHVLKWIAIISMTIDHIGVYLIPFDHPAHIYFRLIGRLAFPLFAFLIAQGYKHTKDVFKYMKRLLIFAAAIEIFMVLFYIVFFNQPSFGGYLAQSLSFNIFWTLLFGLIALYLYHHENLDMKLGILPLLVLSIYLQYSFYGVLLIMVFGIVKSLKWQSIIIFILTALYVFHPLLLFDQSFSDIFLVQMFAVLVMVPVYFYNGKRGKQMRYFFYFYYPLHIALLYGLQYLIYVQ